MHAGIDAGDQLRQLVEQLADGVLVIDRHGALLFANPAAESMLGRPAQDLLGQHIGLPLVPGGLAHEIDLVTRDGFDRVAEMRTVEVEWDGERAYLAALRDVTDRKRLEERLIQASQTLEAIVEASPLPVIQLGVDFSCMFWNAAADRMFLEPDQLSRGTPLPIARDPDNQELFRVPARLGRGETGVRVEAVYRPTDAEERLELAVFLSALREPDGSVSGMVAILEEITEHKRRELEARSDPLTGLGNRRVLMEELALATERARAGWPGALLLLDIDGFKEVNDALGHPAGDKVLAELATRLQGVLRPGDVFARYGGDELAVIPARSSVSDAAYIGERLRACAESYEVAGAPGPISLSIGIVPIDGSLDVSNALEQADRALYEAKRQGRNRVVLREPETP